jgi:hypothetical protein
LSSRVALPQERPGVRRTEERSRGPTNGRLSAFRGARGGCVARRTLSLSAPVRELLSAVVQADRKTARRRTRRQILQRAGDAAPAAGSDPHTSDAVRARLQEICASLDPVALLRDIRSAQQRLADLADVKSADDSTTAAPPIDLFLACLRTAWKEAPLDRRTGRSSKRSEVVVALIRSFRRPLSCWTGSGPSRGEPAPSS